MTADSATIKITDKNTADFHGLTEKSPNHVGDFGQGKPFLECKNRKFSHFKFWYF